MWEIPSVNVIPNAISYTSAISACGDSGQLNEALALLREMPSVGVALDVFSYSAAITACRIVVNGNRRWPFSRRCGTTVSPPMLSAILPLSQLAVRGVIVRRR